MPPKAVEQSILSSYSRFQEEYETTPIKGEIRFKDREGNEYVEPLLLNPIEKHGALYLQECSAGKELHEIRELLRTKLK